MDVFRVVNAPAIGRFYASRNGAMKAASYWRKRGHPLAQAQGSPTVWSAVGGVADASANSESGEGQGGGNTTGPLSVTG
jgi:hypothetical protein